MGGSSLEVEPLYACSEFIHQYRHLRHQGAFASKIRLDDAFERISSSEHLFRHFFQGEKIKILEDQELVEDLHGGVRTGTLQQLFAHLYHL